MGCLVQQGPIQVGFFILALVDGSSEHLMWSHPLHFVHCTDLGPSLFVHTGQNQGPGFCSTPALMSRSRIRQAGKVGWEIVCNGCWPVWWSVLLIHFFLMLRVQGRFAA